MNYSVLTTEQKNRTWLMYLRKSRQDDPTETVEEVLSKHEIMLQDWAKRELGREVPEDCIYREIVSGGESIDDREQVRKVLARIEDPRVAGCLVADPQRLTRGDLEDCGRLISSLRFTSTLIATPMMIYDMNDEMQRKFFEGELLRGREFLDYTKKKLFIGRMQAIRRGLFISKEAPFGYKKIVIRKDHTLEPDENADVVRMVFDLFVNHGLTYYQIAKKLDDMGVKPRKSKTWNKSSIRYMLKNPHYDGKVCFNMVKEVTTMENGEKVTRRVNQPKDTWIVADGIHPAIIDHETFAKAQELMQENATPAKLGYALQNPFAGIMVCAGCGRAIVQHPYKHAETRLECRTRPRCGKSVKMSEVISSVTLALEHSELPNLEAKWKNGDGKALVIQKKLLATLEKEMESYRIQEEKQYEFLETGRYSPDVFDKRNTALRQKMEDCQERIYKAKSTMPKEVNYEERIMALKDAIAGLKDPEITAEEQNKRLKAIVRRIELKTTDAGHNAVETYLKIFLRL